MRSDSVKNMSAYADQNHALSLTDVRLESAFIRPDNGVMFTPVPSVSEETGKDKFIRSPPHLGDPAEVSATTI